MRSTQINWICCDPHPPVPLNLAATKHLVIGRHKSCDLHLIHSCVSRRHAVISVDGGQVYLEDQGSSNGTYLNGKKIQGKHYLALGDMVQIGPFEIEMREKPFNDLDNDQYGVTNTQFLTTGRTAAMAGQIEKTPLVEVFQTIEFNEKTGTLYVECPDGDGFFTFAKGRPITARFKNLKNIEAAMAMLKLGRGNFILSDRLEAVESSINCSITNILFEFSRIQDEISAGS